MIRYIQKIKDYISSYKCPVKKLLQNWIQLFILERTMNKKYNISSPYADKGKCLPIWKTIISYNYPEKE